MKRLIFKIFISMFLYTVMFSEVITYPIRTNILKIKSQSEVLESSITSIFNRTKNTNADDEPSNNEHTDSQLNSGTDFPINKVTSKLQMHKSTNIGPTVASRPTMQTASTTPPVLHLIRSSSKSKNQNCIVDMPKS